MQKELDIRHISIIDALPVYKAKKEVLTVGCGSGFLESKLQEIGYDVIATDYFEKDSSEDTTYLDAIKYQKSSIFDLSSFSVAGRETVICSEVLEHLPNYQEAFQNLLKLTHRRLIITIPWNISYDVKGLPPEGHCNYWTDNGGDPFTNSVPLAEKDPNFKNIREFLAFAWPYHVTITKIGTKGTDWLQSSRCYMIIVDKMQMTDFVWKKSQISHIWELSHNPNTGEYRPNLLPVQIQVNGIPPTRIGPFAYGDVQPMSLLFMSSKKFKDNKCQEWLQILENEVHEHNDNRLLVIEITDETPEDVTGFVTGLNRSRHLHNVVIMIGSLIETFNHNVWNNLTPGIKCINVGENTESSKQFYDSTVEPLEETSPEYSLELAKKIANELS